MRASALACFGKVLLKLGQYCECVAVLEEADHVYKYYFGPTHSVRVSILADKGDAQLLFALQQPVLVGNSGLFDLVLAVFGKLFTEPLEELRAASQRRMHTVQAVNSKESETGISEFVQCSVCALRDYQESYQVLCKHARSTTLRRARAQTRILVARVTRGFSSQIDKQNLLLALRQNRKEYQRCHCKDGCYAVDRLVAYVARAS